LIKCDASLSDIVNWLAGLGLDKHADRFIAYKIDFNTIAHLTEDDFRELGLSIRRPKLLLAISELRGAPQSKPKYPLFPATSEPQDERRQVTVLFADLVRYT
jgi:hypothetical protein